MLHLLTSALSMSRSESCWFKVVGMAAGLGDAPDLVDERQEQAYDFTLVSLCQLVGLL